MEVRLTIRFAGDEAEHHRIPAYEGTQWLTGISRSLVLVNNYLATGTIRKRWPFDESVHVFLESSRPGSFESAISIVLDNLNTIQWIGGGIFLGVTANFVTDFIRSIFCRSIGRSSETTSDKLKTIEEQRPGDIDALVDAIEPAMIQSHSIIGNGAKNIFIIKGDNNVVNLDAQSREYVKGSFMSPDDEFLNVSVGSFNVNTGYGRCFVHSLGKTVPFSIIKKPGPGTFAALSHSLDRYANNQDSDVLIRFRRIVAPDGRTKNFLILGAEPLPE